jgi:hypothetical protein
MRYASRLPSPPLIEKWAISGQSPGRGEDLPHHASSARGRLVHPTVAPFVEHFQHPDVVAIPLRDLPPSTCALAGLRDVEDPARDAFVDIVDALSTT